MMLNEYCKVCKYSDWKGYCRKGWNDFCDKEDFEPSWKTTVLNLLQELYYNDVASEALDEIEDYICKGGGSR